MNTDRGKWAGLSGPANVQGGVAPGPLSRGPSLANSLVQTPMLMRPHLYAPGQNPAQNVAATQVNPTGTTNLLKRGASGQSFGLSKLLGAALARMILRG